MRRQVALGFQVGRSTPVARGPSRRTQWDSNPQLLNTCVSRGAGSTTEPSPTPLVWVRHSCMHVGLFQNNSQEIFTLINILSRAISHYLVSEHSKFSQVDSGHWYLSASTKQTGPLCQPDTILFGQLVSISTRKHPNSQPVAKNQHNRYQ